MLYSIIYLELFKNLLDFVSGHVVSSGPFLSFVHCACATWNWEVLALFFVLFF